MDIHEMRTMLGDTQSEFSTRYNIPFRTVQNWEAGVRRPPAYMLELLTQRPECAKYADWKKLAEKSTAAAFLEMLGRRPELYRYCARG